MEKKVNATEAKNNFGVLLEEVYAKGNTVYIYRNKRPVAKLSPIYTYKVGNTSKALRLNDKDYETIKEAVKSFRDKSYFDF
ncbi:MAG: Antitoxin Phd YefM, type toxin-antitoxin system [Candidatus Parcubacteria bacterium]|jgi:prevent-host-death family protein